MAAGDYTTDALVVSARRRAFVGPTDTGQFPTDADIIALANELMVEYLVPRILQARESHFIVSLDVPLVAGQSAYAIPSRATADDISVVQLVDGNGNPLSWPGITGVELEVGIQNPQSNTPIYPQPGRYYFQGNYLVLTWVPSSGDTSNSLRFRFPQRPNQLVKKASCAAITSMALVGGFLQLGFAAAPAAFTGTSKYEGVTANPGFQVTPLGTATALTGTTATTTATAVPTTLAVGDWLCLEDTAPVMSNVPADLFPLFAQRIAVKVNEIKRDKDGLGASQAGLQEAEGLAATFLGKRDMLSHRKVSAAAARLWLFRPPFWVK